MRLLKDEETEEELLDATFTSLGVYSRGFRQIESLVDAFWDILRTHPFPVNNSRTLHIDQVAQLRFAPAELVRRIVSTAPITKPQVFFDNLYHAYVEVAEDEARNIRAKLAAELSAAVLNAMLNAKLAVPVDTTIVGYRVSALECRLELFLPQAGMRLPGVKILAGFDGGNIYEENGDLLHREDPGKTRIDAETLLLNQDRVTTYFRLRKLQALLPTNE